MDKQKTLSETTKELINSSDDDVIDNDPFDPLTEFKYIGNDVLNHYELLEMEFDWSTMIKLVPLSKVKALVVNRFEFQEQSSDILEPDEISTVSEIKLLLDG